MDVKDEVVFITS